MMETDTDRVRAIHRSPLRLVVVCAGGGSDAVARLLAEPGASRTVLEAIVPYAASAHRAFAPGAQGGAVSRERAQALADRAYDRAVRLSGAEGPVAGVACTAALATDRARKGDEQAFICLRFKDRRLDGRLGFAKGAWSRARQERQVSRTLLAVIASAAEGTTPSHITLIEEPVGVPLSPLASGRHWIVVHRDGQWQPDAEPAPILLPGSFNPLHRGHVRLAGAVEKAFGRSVDLELSLCNADKPPLQDTDLAHRLARIQGRLRVLLTGVPTFLEKARLFPGRTFVVGYDTARRLLEPAYYANDRVRRDAALAEIRDLGGRFVVAGRAANDGFMTLPDLGIPERCEEMFEALPEPRFREDVSATELRNAKAEPGSRS